MSLVYEEFNELVFGLVGLQYVEPNENPLLQYANLAAPQFNYVVEVINEELTIDPDIGHVTFLKNLGYGDSIPSTLICNEDSNKAIFYSLKSPIFLSGNVTSDCQLDLTIVSYMGVILDKVNFSGLSKLTVISGNPEISDYQLSVETIDEMKPAKIGDLSCKAELEIYTASVTLEGKIFADGNLKIDQRALTPAESTPLTSGSFIINDKGNITSFGNITLLAGSMLNKGAIKAYQNLNITTANNFANQGKIVIAGDFVSTINNDFNNEAELNLRGDLYVKSKFFKNSRYINSAGDAALNISKAFTNNQNAFYQAGSLEVYVGENLETGVFTNHGKIQTTNSSILITASAVNLLSSDFKLNKEAFPAGGSTYRDPKGLFIAALGLYTYSWACEGYKDVFVTLPTASLIYSNVDIKLNSLKLRVQYGFVLAKENIDFNVSEFTLQDIKLENHILCKKDVRAPRFNHVVNAAIKHYANKYLQRAVGFSNGGVVPLDVWNSNAYQTLSSHIHAGSNITGNINDLSIISAGAEIPNEIARIASGTSSEVALVGESYLDGMIAELSSRASNLLMLPSTDQQLSLVGSVGYVMGVSTPIYMENMIKAQILGFEEYIQGDVKYLFMINPDYLIPGETNALVHHSSDNAFIESGIPYKMSHEIYEKAFQDEVLNKLGLLSGINPTLIYSTLRSNCYKAIDYISGFNSYIKEVTPALLDSLLEPVICPVLTNDCGGVANTCLDMKLLFTDKLMTEFIEESLISADENIDLTVSGDALVQSMKAGKEINIEVEGNSYVLGKLEAENINITTAKNFINLGNISSIQDVAISALNLGIAGKVKAGKDLNLKALDNLVISTLVAVGRYSGGRSNVVHSQIISEAKIEAGENVNISSENNAMLAGVEVIGNKVYVKSGGSLHIIPVQLYNELTRWGKRYFESHRSLKLHRSIIMSDSGDVHLEVNDKSLLSGVMTKSGQAIMLASNSDLEVNNPSEYESHILIVKKKGFLGTSIGAKKTTRSSYVSNLIGSVYEAVTSIAVKTLGDQTWQGVELVAASVELEAGTPEREAMISFLAAYEETKYELITEKSKFKFSIKGSKLSYAEYKKSSNVKTTSRAFPNIVRVEDSFYVHSSGKFYAVSPQITANSEAGESKIIIDASHIQVDASPNLDFDFAMMRKGSIGVGFKAGGGELSVGVYASYEDSSMSLTKLFHNQGKFEADFISLNADKIEDKNVLYQAQKMEETASIIYHGVAKDVILQNQKLQSIEMGVKIGIKSNLGSIKANIESLSETDDSPESLISSAFTMWSLYNNVLTLLSSSTNHGITGGVWFYVEGQISQSKASLISPKPVIFNVNEFNSTSDELTLVSTQYQAYKGYIESKYLDIKAEKTIFDSSAKSYFVHGEIPLFGIGNIVPSIGGGFSKSKSHEEHAFTANIFVSDSLTMNIDGKARIEGSVIDAGSLEANFNELLIASMLDVSKQMQRGASVTLGLDPNKLTNVKGLNQIGAEIGNGKAHAVETITSLLGRDVANIVVANALRMNGAMIACAERDENGEFTDHGNLTLEVGKLFIEHIQLFDEGKSLQASVAMGGKLFVKDKSGNKTPYMTLNGAASAHSYEGVVYGTIGEGDVTVEGESELGEANRDVKRSVTYDENYDINPIEFYYTDGDNSELEIPSNLREFKDSLGEAVFEDTGLSKIFERGKDAIKSALPESWFSDDDNRNQDDSAQNAGQSSFVGIKGLSAEDSEYVLERIGGKAQMQGFEDSNTAKLKVTLELIKQGYSAKDAVDIAIKAVNKAAMETPPKVSKVFAPALILAGEGVAMGIAACARNPECSQRAIQLISAAIALLGGAKILDSRTTSSGAEHNKGTKNDLSEAEMGQGSTLITPIPEEQKPDIESLPLHEDDGYVETFPAGEEPKPKILYTPIPDNIKPDIEIFPIPEEDYIAIIFTFEIDGKKYQEHHVVSDKNKHTKNHKLWKLAGVDKQSRDNKIFLPTEKEHHPTRSIHKGRHWDKVSEELSEEMNKATNKGKAEGWSQVQYKEKLDKILQKERARLKSGERALNKNMREWSDDKGRK